VEEIKEIPSESVFKKMKGWFGKLDRFTKIYLATMLIVAIVAPIMLAQRAIFRPHAASSGTRPVAVFYYSGWSTSIKNRFLATMPRYVVLDIGNATNPWGTVLETDIAEVQAAGITLLAYIPIGGMRGFIWNTEDTTDKTPTNIRALIDKAVAKGFKGVFFDEGALYTSVSGQSYQDSFLDRNLVAPGAGAGGSYNGHPIESIVGNPKYNAATAEAWKGLTIDYYLRYAKDKGLFVTDNFSDGDFGNRFNPNIYTIADAVLTTETYNGRAPQGNEVANKAKTWVLSYDGTFNAANTLAAINYGFGAAYNCESMGSLSSNYETYMAQIPISGSSAPASIPTSVPVPTSASSPTSAPTSTSSTTYTLTIKVSGQGTTSPAPGTYQIPRGQQVTVQATPASGWKFLNWSNYSNWAENPTSWSMVEPIEIVAVFQATSTAPTIVPTIAPTRVPTPVPTSAPTPTSVPSTTKYTLTIKTSGQGTTAPAAGTYQIPAGQKVSVQAVPSSGWKFLNWSNYPTWAENPTSWPMIEPVTITAVFQAISPTPTPISVKKYTLIIKTSGSGTTTPAAGTYQIPAGQRVSVKATPAYGWKFLNWSNYPTWAENPTSWPMTQPITITAVFGR
jgi:hypothetical protein